MIRPDRHANALYALQGVLVWARRMDYEGAPSRDMADILDRAEILPSLIARPHTDETDLFRESLVELAARHGCGYIVQRFDDPAPPVW